MAFYNPTIISPKSVQEIIYNTNNTFSWQANGDITQVAYQLYIRRVSDNVQVYDSTKTTSSNENHTVPSGTLATGVLYKWIINSYYDGTNYKSSKWEIFKAISTPTVTISSTPSTQQSYEFGFSYNHPNLISVKTYKVGLYQGSTLIDESDDIYPDSLITYSSTPLTYTFEGMQSGQTYQVECVVTDQNDYQITSGKISFSINYTYPDTISGLAATINNTNGSITLDWINIIQVLPVVTGSYEYLNDTWTVEHDIKSEFDSGYFSATESFVNGVQMKSYGETWNDFGNKTWIEIDNLVAHSGTTFNSISGTWNDYNDKTWLEI